MACGPFFLKRQFHPGEPSPKWSPEKMLRSGRAQSALAAVVQTRCPVRRFWPNGSFAYRSCAAAKSLRESTPFAALFRDIQNRVQHLQIGQTYISALHREALFDAGILLFRDFHPSNILPLYCSNSVNTP